MSINAVISDAVILNLQPIVLDFVDGGHKFPRPGCAIIGTIVDLLLMNDFINIARERVPFRLRRSVL